MDGATALIPENRLEFEALPCINLKGKAAPFQVFKPKFLKKQKQGDTTVIIENNTGTIFGRNMELKIIAERIKSVKVKRSACRQFISRDIKVTIQLIRMTRVLYSHS